MCRDFQRERIFITTVKGRKWLETTHVPSEVAKRFWRMAD
jgi:hypothetical protein